LFDNLAAQIGIHLSFFGPSYRFVQGRGCNPFLPGKAFEA
jgi:hypothetical protein